MWLTIPPPFSGSAAQNRMDDERTAAGARSQHATRSNSCLVRYGYTRPYTCSAGERTPMEAVHWPTQSLRSADRIADRSVRSSPDRTAACRSSIGIAVTLISPTPPSSVHLPPLRRISAVGAPSLLPSLPLRRLLVSLFAFCLLSRLVPRKKTTEGETLGPFAAALSYPLVSTHGWLSEGSAVECSGVVET